MRTCFSRLKKKTIDRFNWRRIDLISKVLQVFFVFFDITELSALEDLDDSAEKAEKKDEIMRDYGVKSERIHPLISC